MSSLLPDTLPRFDPDASNLEFEVLENEIDPTVETPADALLIGQTLGLVHETLSYLEDMQTEAQRLRARQDQEEKLQREREEERMRRLRIIADGYRRKRREQQRQERLRQRQRIRTSEFYESSIDGLSDLSGGESEIDILSSPATSRTQTSRLRHRLGYSRDAGGPLSPLGPASAPTLGLGFGIDEAVLLAASDLSVTEAQELERSTSTTGRGGGSTQSQRILLYCCVEGLPSPFCLLSSSGLSDEHYVAIISQYYTNVLFQGQPPGELVLLKRVIFGQTVQQLLREEENETDDQSQRQDGQMELEIEVDHELQRNRNEHRLYHFKRRFDVRAHKFRMHVQMHMPVYDEPMPSELSVVTKRRGGSERSRLDDAAAAAGLGSASPSAAGSASPPSSSGGGGGGVAFPTMISLNRLILLATDPYCDKRLLDVLWWQYREFLTPQILLEKLIQRFDVPSLADDDERNHSGEEVRFFDTYLRRAIQINVARMLAVFIRKYPFDFDDEMASKLKRFAARRIAREFPYIARMIGHGLKKPRVHAYELPRVPKEGEEAVPKRPYIGRPPDFDLFEFSPKVLAEQLTFLDFDVYRSIDFSEMLNCAWEKSNQEQIAPNLVRSERFHDRVRGWVASWVLMKDNVEERVKATEHLIRTFSELFQLCSFNVLHAFYDAFGLTPVYRLSQTWEAVDRQLNLKREEIADTVAPGREHKLQALMDRCSGNGQPCCPYIRLYLRFLKDKGREDGLSTGRINLEKYRAQTEIMKNVLRFQRNPFDIRPEATIIWHILDFDLNPGENSLEEYLVKRSMKLES